MNVQDLFQGFREKGFRITTIRKGIIEIFVQSKKPLTAPEIGQKLKKNGLIANKTTIYRELDFLRQQDLIEELQLSDKIKSYEWKSDHHHHLVCRECHTIKRVDLDELESTFPKVEKELKVKTRFSHIDHHLEFFGLCARCS